VGMEDLNIKGMMKNRCLARRIAQASWGQLKTYLSYKTNVKMCDRWYPSSKTCSVCGCIQLMPLNFRTYECCGCGISLDRDLNAAINIRNITFGTKESYACGDTSVGDVGIHASRHVSMKQEKFETTCSDTCFGQEAHASLGRG
jgi:putative transposase